MCAGWPQVVTSQRKAHLAAAGSWRAPRAVPGSSHGPDLATYRSPAAHTVSISMRSDRNMQWESMGQMQDAGLGGGDTCRIRTRAFCGFWWGSEPQMLLVQQPEWLLDGCKAMEAEARGNGMMSHCRLPRHLNYSAAWPLVPPGCKNSNFVVSELAVSKLYIFFGPRERSYLTRATGHNMWPQTTIVHGDATWCCH